MRYCLYFIGSCLVAAVTFYAQVFLLFPAPVAADYWVREMLVMKREIARRESHERKIIVSAGSSVLFSIDTNQISDAFGIPAVNYGLMAGLPLETILRETDSAAKSGDFLILAFEPDYYCREANHGYNEWQVRNAMAWDYEYWRAMAFTQKVVSISQVNPLFPIEMIKARIDLWFKEPAISLRLAALDDATVKQKYANPPLVADNLYSIFNIDSLGNIRNTDEASYLDAPPSRADQPIPICDQTFIKLSMFVEKMKKRDVSVFFMNAPFMELPDLDKQKMQKFDADFYDNLSKLAPVLDRKFEILVPRDYFLNSDMHLNRKGRDFRTQLLIERLRDQIKKLDAFSN